MVGMRSTRERETYVVEVPRFSRQRLSRRRYGLGPRKQTHAKLKPLAPGDPRVVPTHRDMSGGWNTIESDAVGIPLLGRVRARHTEGLL